MGVYNQGAAEVISPDESSKWLIQPHDYKRLAELIIQFYTKRYAQTLCKPFDIDVLIKDFLENIVDLK